MISVSKKLSAADFTATTTSPEPGEGSGRSANSSSSGPPKCVQRMAFMVCCSVRLRRECPVDPVHKLFPLFSQLALLLPAIGDEDNNGDREPTEHAPHRDRADSLLAVGQEADFALDVCRVAIDAVRHGGLTECRRLHDPQDDD